VQANHSCSKRGVLRGMHWQVPPHAQGKLVRVVRGAAWDVAADIRPGSPTFGRWVAMELSEANRKMMWIPEGFAHGFVALEDETHFLYKTTDVYAKDCERSLRWDDKTLAIAWPDLGLEPLVAAKDAAAPSLAELGLS
jgi:dTDP-4-dehydrorhamnose 3,5-epimerase